MSLKTQCELLSLNRTHLYYQPLPASPDELVIKRRIDELYTARPFYGSRKITVLLQQEMTINRKAVQRHMREMGIAGIVPGPNTSKQAADHRVFPYLLRHITAGFPNHIWGIEIVCTQMTKTGLLAVMVSWDHIADLDLRVGDDYPVNQQLN